jgi:ParB-like chromosome segregation protein Spo0J
MMLVKITKLKGNPSNPRVLRDDKFAKLKASIEAFPDMLQKRPIVAVTDKDGKLMVLGGNMRLKACADLGMKEVPVILADEWTEEQRREFIIKDNVGYGEWDWDALSEWDYKELNDWGLDIPGYDLDGEFSDKEGYDFQNKVTLEFKTIEEARTYFDKATGEGLKARLS